MLIGGSRQPALCRHGSTQRRARECPPFRRSPLASADEVQRLLEWSTLPVYTCTTTTSTLTADGTVYTDGVPANPVLVNVWVRAGHPEAETTRLATEIAAAVARIINIAADRHNDARVIDRNPYQRED